jgi:hypothetical protein
VTGSAMTTSTRWQLPSGSRRAKVYGTDLLTGWEIRFRKTCKTEQAAHIEFGKLLAMAQAGRQLISGEARG